jgi:hypothetical protein
MDGGLVSEELLDAQTFFVLGLGLRMAVNAEVRGGAAERIVCHLGGTLGFGEQDLMAEDLIADFDFGGFFGKFSFFAGV